MRKVTILTVVNESVYTEEPGYLVEDRFAAYVDRYGLIHFMEVEQGDNPDIYREVSPIAFIGRINARVEDEETVLRRIFFRMKTMSLYDYFTKIHARDTDYEFVLLRE